MDKYFSLIFWGLLIVIIDISINNLDLLVDGVGYLMVAGGCRGLIPLSARFATARTLCFVLAIMWLVRFVVVAEFATILGIATMIVDCAMIWNLLGGIAEFASDRKRPDLAQRAFNRRIAYLVFMIATTLFVWLVSDSVDAGFAAVAIIIAMVVILTMILHLIHRVKKELATGVVCR